MIYYSWKTKLRLARSIVFTSQDLPGLLWVEIKRQLPHSIMASSQDQYSDTSQLRALVSCSSYALA